MIEYQPNQPPQTAHHALKASLLALEKAQKSAVLWFGDILDRSLFR